MKNRQRSLRKDAENFQGLTKLKTLPERRPDETADNNTREKILRVTRELIARQGIHDTSLAAIASEAGISRGTLFYYFASKQSLLYHIMDNSFAEVNSIVERAISGIPPGAGAAELINLTLQIIGESRSLNQITFHLFQEAVNGDETLRHRFQESYRRWQKLITVLLREHFPRTASRFGAPALASLLLALIDGISIQALLDYEFVKYPETAQALTTIFATDGGDSLHEQVRRN